MPPSARALLARLAPDFPARHVGEIYTETTEFMRIGHGDVINLGERHFLVLRDEAERRFGLEDPKFWVKRCRDLQTGQRRILKLVFHESFPMTIGSMVVTCTRSPRKESRILDLVRGDDRFMQGETIPDTAGNPVRILDVVPGKRLDEKIEALEMPHRDYFFELFPEVLTHFIEACQAIAWLHARNEKHGDVRRDHLYVRYDSGTYTWIDFDYTFDFQDSPFGLDLFGLGNIIQFLVGMGQHTTQSVPPEVRARITTEDCSIMFPNRIVNLRKLFPYVPEALNNVLLRFSMAANVFYDATPDLIRDLERALDAVRSQR
ncbi:serine/threonine protein kinase [Solidesulfovibrio sp.]|uniref:serine/threonine protein kinase n=1 Tax=Solidesulfovibrio sp. TaxID=2910990 RepID=UPI000EEFC3C4|nr:serine/threonine protein kinase [Solidesulfovibrio sp.]MEA5090213.1 serine/threonine protein kinase [Solidesulfovibrio sp.]HCR13723.1 serine/threonine protein kinase [Desulfovibrio sp.]HML59644.1 serine/threonine protein kinase [Solidesulfovibrio sp.]